MIDTTKIEQRLSALKDTEEGNKPFNKWTTETRYQVALSNFNAVTKRNTEILNHRGELVIDNYNIVRLEDVEDGGDDYYWCYNKWVGWKGMDEQDEGKYQASCVGGHIRLKGFIPDEEYDRLVYVWNLNNFVKAI